MKYKQKSLDQIYRYNIVQNIVYVLESRLNMIQFHSTIPTSCSNLNELISPSLFHDL